MAKSAEAFRSIGEVADLIGVASHVLRYWETQFPTLKPMKRTDGRRYYRPADVDLAAGICTLLRDDGLTIRGALKLIAADRGAAVRQRGTHYLTTRGGAPVQPVPDPDTRPDPVPTTPEPPPFDDPGFMAPARPGAGQAPTWLSRLTHLARHLQQAEPCDAHWMHLRPAAARLAHAMLRLS